MSSGSSFPNSPQPTTASNSPFHYSLIHSIPRPDGKASPTKITPLSPNGETFVVSYSDAAIIVYDTRTGEPTGTMASLETYDGTIATSVNAVVATVVGLDQPQGLGEEESGGGGPTGGGRAMAGSGVEGVIISGHEDCYVRFFDANSGKFHNGHQRLGHFPLLTQSPRSVHLQYGCPSRFHLRSLPQPRRSGVSERRS